MHNSVYQTQLRAGLEANYLCTYINQYRQHYTNAAKIELNVSIEPCDYSLEHDLLLPLINDAFRFGIFKVHDPAIMFDLQLNNNCLTFGVHYHINTQIFDERTQVAFLKIKRKLEAGYPGMHVLYRDYYQDTYLVLLQIKFK